ncbi:hypothetical protein HYN59_17025 [Flavobacterium album]|uniref:Sugar-binding protein n=1 Tax=Flavobacterium album TaxID=2175091 RepID=A0A2S1R1V5_9FLAO|nr:hypothetical protein [Flavobacterium album]AWH86703.1 hypothetical protein HYN59_17025 [Flavobacterium album]
MKYLYPLALLLVLVSCRDEETKESVDRSKADWPFYKLEGNVKEVSEKSYEIDAAGQKGGTKNEIASSHDNDLTFNEKGMLVSEKLWLNATTPFEEIKYNGRENMLSKVQYINGQIGIKTENSRDKSGNITGIIRRNADNSQIDRIAMTYEGKKLMEKKTFNNQDNPNDRITYVYDSNGNLKGENLYLGSEYVQVKNLYEYDGQNRKISESRYSKDKPLYTMTYGYDGKNVTKKETTDGKGVVLNSEKSSYDKKGNLVKRYTIDNSDKSEVMDSYTYDSKGNVTSWTMTRNNAPEMRVVYKYDGHNNATAVKTVNGKGEIIDDRTYTYEYDDKGNWTKKTVTLNNKPFTVVERKITYFPTEE